MKLVEWFESRCQESSPDERADPRVVFYETQRDRAEAVAKDAEAKIDQIRKRADAWGRGALALGYTGLTALGIGKLTDSVPDGHWSAAWIIVAGCVLAVTSLVFVASRLTKVSTPIVMNTRVSLMPELKRCGGGPNQKGRSLRRSPTDPQSLTAPVHSTRTPSLPLWLRPPSPV